MSLGIVIPTTAGREENLKLVLRSLDAQGWRGPTVIVDDGGQMAADFPVPDTFPHVVIGLDKHEPGMEQPRNVGVRALEHWFLHSDAVTHAWFLDSDVVVKHGALAEIEAALSLDSDRVLVGPYEWLDAGVRPPADDGDWGAFWRQAIRVRNDPRWPLFDIAPSTQRYLADLSAGLACFSGNLVWPIDRFQHVGGFWSEIHHGRCEDGELGLRAVAMEVPISFIAAARGFHLWHQRNDALAIERNRRDVPMLNERHPWVERGAVFMTDRDGAAFDVRCRCGQVVHTIAWYAHAERCDATPIALPVAHA